MDAVKVLQVVGFKNSGKTTLILQLLDLAKSKGKMVSTIKHHSHGGALETPSSRTDSMRFFEQGAATSVAYGDGVIQLHMQNDQASLEELIAMTLQSNLDIVIAEGFKAENYEKVVLVRSEQDWLELQKLTNIVLTIVHSGVQLNGIQVIKQNQKDQLERWFFEWMVK